MYKQPKRYRKAFQYIFEEKEKFYFVLKVEDNVCIAPYKFVTYYEGYYEKWIKSLEDRLGYKIKIYGDKTASLISKDDKLYKIVKWWLKKKELEKDFEKETDNG